MRHKSLLLAWGVLLGLLVIAPRTYAGLFTWKAATTGDWAVAANWTNNAVPGDGDSVEITNSGSGVFLSSSSSNLNSVLLSQALTFTNWDTALRATTVNIASGATLTCSGPFFSTNVPVDMSNRVWIVCTNLTIDAGGNISTDYRGYAPGFKAAGNGPGAGAQNGGAASHGGRGASGPAVGQIYGVTNEPTAPGSGGGDYTTTGGYSGPGGGAVRVQASGTVICNGRISADGSNTASRSAGAGSGGSIFVTAHQLAGNGVISARGGAGVGTLGLYKNGGGGGRIAVIYDTATPGIVFTVAGGASGDLDLSGDAGTLYFSDNSFLNGTFLHSGQWCVDGFTNWAPENLVISNSWLRIADEGFQLSVSNAISVQGTNTWLNKLEFASARVSCGSLYASNGTFRVGGSGATGVSSFVCAQDVVLTNNASLYVQAGLTNAAHPDYGATVSVTGTLWVAPNAWIYPISHPTNGGSVRFQVNSLRVSLGGGIDADELGFISLVKQGCGPGGGGWFTGGGYGGKGGDYAPTLLVGGTTYGSSNAPAAPGSGGGGNNNSVFGKNGGGLISVYAKDTIAVDGTVTACGGTSTVAKAGGGSGGGIYLVARTFTGNGGIIRADGGATTVSGAGSGGGGRVAIRRTWDTFSGTLSATNGSSVLVTERGETGTVLMGGLPGLAISPQAVTVPVETNATTNLTFSLWNSGLDTNDLFWTASSASAWMTFPTAGVIAVGQTNTITVTNSAVGLVPGQWYTGVVTFAVTSAVSYLYPAPILTNLTVVLGVYASSPMPIVQFQPLASSGDESVTPVVLSVVLDSPTPQAVTVNYSANGGSATGGGVDYTLAPGTLTLNPGAISSNIYLAVVNDLRDETNESVIITLSNAVNAMIGAASNYTYTILDNDVALWITGSGTQDWFTATNWNGSYLPVAGNDVVITNTGVKVLLTNSTVNLNSLALGTTLIMSNWNTALNAVNVTVQTNGILTCAGPFWSTNVPVDMSNRVWVVAGLNVTLDLGGRIDVDAKGYSASYTGGPGSAQGPGGGGSGSGGGHGGRGGDGSGTTPGNVAGNRYDLTNAPTAPGSGGAVYSGSAGGHGGGAVLVDATNGTVTVNGTITANGQAGTYGGGSGGSVYIRCRRLAGSAPGAITAKGGPTASRSGMGGGGRISVVYDASAQASGARPSTRFDVSPGAGLLVSALGRTLGAVGEPGTLYFPDTQVLTTNVTGMSGRLFGIGAWLPDRLTVDNCWLEFGENIQLSVTNDIAVINGGSLGGNWITCGGNMSVSTGTVYLYSGNWKRVPEGSSANPVYHDYGTNPPPILTVGGDLTLTGTNLTNCAIYVYAVATNAAASTNYGALVTVTGQLRVGTNTAIYPISELLTTNGGSPLFRVGRLQVDAGGFIEASGFGFRGGVGGVRDGTGPGRGKNATPAGGGGGYGGVGGIFSAGVSGMTYGSSNAPVDAGSGGGMGSTSGSAGNGGGLIRVEAPSGTITVRGALRSVGDNCANSTSGGGAGGGIYLTCKNFMGDGATIVADGGNASGTAYGGGGGGRIAVWSVSRSTNGLSISAAGGTSVAGGISNGVAGTIVWGQLPMPRGTVIAIW